MAVIAILSTVAAMFTTVHGHVTATSISALKPFTTAYGPVIISTTLPTSTTPITFAASSEPTNALFSEFAPPVTVSHSRIKRVAPPQIEGIDVDHVNGTDCHPHNGDYIYFTVAHPNGTIATSKKHQQALFSVDSTWMLSYWNRLRNAFLNNPKESNGDPKYDACKGYCYSEVIPKVQFWDHPVMLKRINDPEPLREGWNETRCQYNNARGITKNKAKLANIGYFIYGAEVPSEILDFMEAKIRKTYPTLEITLICLLTVGLLPSLFVFMFILAGLIELAKNLDYRVRAKAEGGQNTQFELRSRGAGVHYRARRAHDIQQQARGSRQQARGSQQQARGFQQQSHPLPQLPLSRPPTYKPNDVQWRAEYV
jgi:hypothetical protein